LVRCAHSDQNELRAFLRLPSMSTSLALVLARGLGSRMRAPDPDANITPEQSRAADAGLKAMMPVNGRPFLDYVLSSLADAGIGQVALIVAPDYQTWFDYYTAAPPARLTLRFIVQREAIGTADAVLAAEEWLRGQPFLTVNADNLYPGPALQALAGLDEPGLAAFEPADLMRSGNIAAERIQSFALLETDTNGYLTGIVEKPGEAAASAHLRREDALISMNCWRFDSRIFQACRDVERSPRGEFELPQAVGLAVRRQVPFKVLRARGGVLDLSRRADAVEVARRLRDIEVRP
jgi:dTDP-glucose pyrophosphorylase